MLPDDAPKAVISLKAGLSDTFLPQTVAHELGHYASADPRQPEIAKVLMALPPTGAPNAKYVANRYGPLADRNAENMSNPSPRMDAYALESPEERRAQAFANAFATLQELASAPDDYRAKIGAAEATVPGTGDVLKGMLRQPIYAKHPLRGVIK